MKTLHAEDECGGLTEEKRLDFLPLYNATGGQKL